jgi:hypothetical protein
MPVLTGQFDPGAPRMTFEQSASRWEQDFLDLGFEVERSRVCDYWWAPAFLLVAHGE